MARAIVMVVLLAWGCTDAPVLEVQTPLFVFNSYPASGATLAVGDLGELSFTFSEDLGEARDVEAATAALLTLENRDGPLELGPPSYDADTFTLSFPVTASLMPGGHVATLEQSLTSSAGRSLPTDFVVQFQLAQAP